MSDCSFTPCVLNIHQSVSGYSSVWLLHGWWNCCRLGEVQKFGASSLFPIQPCTSLRHTIRSHIHIYISSFVLQNKKTVAARQKDLDKMAQRIQEVKDASEKDTADYAAAQKHFQAVSSGLSANDDGEAATLNEQLLGTTWRHCLFCLLLNCHNPKQWGPECSCRINTPGS